ncbi:MAG: hypothetical protein ABI729_02570 [Chitinophagales bacterium]
MRTLIFLLTLLTTLTAQTTFAQINDSWAFKNELISYMQTPGDTIYIQDRKKLEEIKEMTCADTTVTFNDMSKSGERIYITISKTKFISAKHTIEVPDTVFKFIHNEKRVDYLIVKDLIDGRPAYGIDGNYPLFELNRLTIKWNGAWLTIPDSAFHNLYETHLCSAEAYLTNDNKLLYLYISASDGAGSYAVKLVFNRRQYLTRIVNRNEMTDGYDFLDANTKEE